MALLITSYLNAQILMHFKTITPANNSFTISCDYLQYVPTFWKSKYKVELLNISAMNHNGPWGN